MSWEVPVVIWVLNPVDDTSPLALIADDVIFPVNTESPVWLNGPILLKVLDPEIVNEPVIVVLPFIIATPVWLNGPMLVNVPEPETVRDPVTECEPVKCLKLLSSSSIVKADPLTLLYVSQSRSSGLRW